MQHNIKIERMTYGIDSLGYLDGKVVFAPYGAPGDEVEVQVEQTKPDYLRARINKVLKPSDVRVESPCPNFPECGGCHWLHIHPETQRTEKEAYLKFLLKPLNPKLVYPLEPLSQTSYRNKMELKIARKEDGRFILGNYRYHSHDVVSLRGCIVQDKANMELYESLDALLNNPANEQLALSAEQIVVRTLGTQQHALMQMKTAPSEESLVALRTFFDTTDRLSRLEVSGSGTTHLVQVRDRGQFNFMERNWIVSPRSFFQNNLEGAESILFTLSTIYGSVPQKGKLLDLYCGCGAQTLHLESRFEEVYAIESNEDSYQDAIKNQRLRTSSRAKFLCRKVETIFGTPITKGIITAVHLNPPRSGLSTRAIRGMSGIKPKTVTYLSCNPITFKRDAQALIGMGYVLENVHSFDLFPGTYHVEVLGVFSRW